MKKSYWKIVLILWDVLFIGLRIFSIETSIIGNTNKHNNLRTYLLRLCTKRGWDFTSDQIDTGIKNTIFILKKIFKRR